MATMVNVLQVMKIVSTGEEIDLRDTLGVLLETLAAQKPGSLSIALTDDKYAVFMLRLSWSYRLNLMRDLAKALAQCHQGILDPSAYLHIPTPLALLS